MKQTINRRLRALFSLLVFTCPGLAQAQDVSFTDRALEAGVEARGRNRGIAFGDFDADGFDDLVICRLDAVVALCRNMGDGTFKDVTADAGLANASGAKAPVWFDVDNDGWLDLYLVGFGLNRLYHNEGDGTFTDVTDTAGVGSDGPSVAVASADVDNDGFLDLYVANFQAPNLLYMNQGDGTFRDASAEAGAGHGGLAMGIMFCDYDLDGDQDLLLSHDGDQGNILLQNDGEGHFVDKASNANVSYAPMAMGAAFADYNRDGNFDLYLTLLGENLLYRNAGGGLFWPTEYTNTGDAGMGWGTTWWDYDNDGWLDLYVANESGYSTPPMENVLYRNLGDGTFVEVMDGAGTSSHQGSFGCATADVNRDGYLDLFVTNNGANNHLYVSSGGSNHWLRVQLEGVESNRPGVGARLRVVTGDEEQHSEVSAGGGYASQSSLTQHFGLGLHSLVDTLEIRWPGGALSRHLNIAADQVILVKEGDGIASEVKRPAQAPPTGHALGASYPNPFAAAVAGTHIPFVMGGGSASVVTLVIYDQLGRRVRALAAGPYEPGRHEVLWDGRDDRGVPLAAGVYHLVMRAGDFEGQRAMLMLR